MSIIFPLALPTYSRLSSVTFRMVNTAAKSESIFTGDQQIQEYPKQRWEVDVSVSPMRQDAARAWIAWLASLRGIAGTFTMGDPMSRAPSGTATAATVSGSAGSSSVVVTMAGTLLAGDYIQIGTGLHYILADCTDTGELNIWPTLRNTVSGVAAGLINPVGRFRMLSNTNGWTVNDAQAYGLSFSAEEAL